MQQTSERNEKFRSENLLKRVLNLHSASPASAERRRRRERRGNRRAASASFPSAVQPGGERRAGDRGEASSGERAGALPGCAGGLENSDALDAAEPGLPG